MSALTEKLIRDYGYTPEQIQQDADRNREVMRKLNAMTVAGRARGYVDQDKDLQAFKNA